MRRNIKKTNDINEWLEIINPIINSEEFIKRKTFRHHGNTSVYEHCMRVSLQAYKMAKLFHSDYRSAAIAGLLHDFYTTPWQDVKIKQPFLKMHAFSHASDALNNAKKFYPDYLNKKVENAILRHMFPLNITPPTHMTSYIVTIADKISSLDFLMSKEALVKTFSFIWFLKR